MKTRIISAVIASLIIFPIILIGGKLYIAAVYLFSLIGLYELIKIKESKKKIPIFIKFILFSLISFLVLNNIYSKEIILSIDYRIIASLILTLLIPAVLYHNKDIYSVEDAFFLCGLVFFLGTAFNLLIIIRNIDFHILIYLLTVTITTDIFAYFTGYFIGQNKLLETVSPKKTWEGLIGGTIAGVFVSTVFYMHIVDTNTVINNIIIVSAFLSILGQLGDLVFSAIKRYYNCKDFSNLMPGHGGVLDRLDSIIFVLLGFMFFINII